MWSGEIALFKLPLIAVGILHLVATKKDGITPALLASGPFFVAVYKSLGYLGKCA